MTTIRESSGVLPRTAERSLPFRVTPAKGAPSPTPASEQASAGAPLRRILVAFDATCLILSWTVALTIPLGVLGARSTEFWPTLIQVAVGTAVGLLGLAAHRLYLARVCSVRAVELSRTFRAVVVSAVAVAIVSEPLDVPFSLARGILGASLAFLAVGMVRGIYSAMLRSRRARGLHGRPIVIVGTNADALEVARLVQTHPEFGYHPSGVVGRLDEYQQWPMKVPYLGTVDDALEAVLSTGSNGVLIAASALEADDINRLTREFLANEIHVHLSTGLWGIDARRLRSVPLAHEPLFYVERQTFSRWSRVTKRSLDVLLSSLVLLFLSPVLLTAAVAVKLSDRGPILFKQTRVGRNGRHITVYKFRTMVPGAENMLSEVAKANGNLRDGVLFKLEDDPRLTRVGRILEAASIDELPQLFNVLQGTMSLVGPRPALPSEVAQFDDELLTRLSVPPGITGLWQVEARDNPSFSAYKRLDLFYVENWSLTLDLALLVETVSSVLSRLARGRR